MKYNINEKGFSLWISHNTESKESELAKKVLGGKCYICGKVRSSYCNSHSIPQFVLNNLSKCGEYSTFVAMVDKPFLKPTVGKNKAGTFRLICSDCDNTFFKEYENKDLWLNLQIPLPPLFLSKINIKNLIYLIGKANYELGLSKSMLDICKAELDGRQAEISNALSAIKAQSKQNFVCSYVRVKKYEQLYWDAKQCVDKNIETEKLIYLRNLPYTVPIAIQCAIPVGKGIGGETINDFENRNEPFHMLNLCVFPLESKSVILLSCHIFGTRYDTFVTEFNGLPLDRQLEIINYMIFQHSEDFLGNIEVFQKVSQNRELLDVCQQVSVCDLTMTKIPKIPNLLSSNFAL